MRPFVRTALLLSACSLAFLSLSAVAAAAPSHRAAETILGFMVDEQGITFRVPSSGCTGKGDFTVSSLATTPRHLDLIRLHPDPCPNDVPLGRDIFFSWTELGFALGDSWEIGNRIQMEMQAPGAGPFDTHRVSVPPVYGSRPECLLGIKVHPEGITYRVENRGCTTKQDFQVHAMDTTPLVLVLVRIGDDCGAPDLVPHFTDLLFTWKELGVDPGESFQIGNQLQREGTLRSW